jgi:hypothetical protein
MSDQTERAAFEEWWRANERDVTLLYYAQDAARLAWQARAAQPAAEPLSDALNALRELVKATEELPFDVIVCYASTIDEYEPNRLAANASKALANARAVIATNEAKR